jgi:hypothetical protein
MFSLCCFYEMLKKRMMCVQNCDIVTHLKMVNKNLCMSDDHTMEPRHGQIDAVLQNVSTTHNANILSLQKYAEIYYF